VLLLVDATQGVQAQTLANFYLALEAELDVIPIISKMDLPTANADAVAIQMVRVFWGDFCVSVLFVCLCLCAGKIGF
jgi:translation elongation factor EF-4